MFKGRQLVIATKHKKEKSIAPLLEHHLGIVSNLPENFDTDELGTFTGEVERTLDPIEAVRKKCLLAMEQTNCDLGVASEGSFGPHPQLVFVPADDEFLIFIDAKNNLEIIVRELSTETNFNASVIKTENELNVFANAAKFPSHGLIIRRTKDDFTEITKGITDTSVLKKSFQLLQQKYGEAYLETDMRAMYNPSRMKVIEKATEKLIEKINSLCPQCSTPGFDVTGFKAGLPCGLCGSPTRSIWSYTYACKKCEFHKEVIHPNNKEVEDPRFCDSCNP